MGIALSVGSLRVDNRDIGIEWGHHGNAPIAIGTFDALDEAVHTRHIRACVAPQRKERQPRCPGGVPAHHSVMGIFFEVERSGDALLYGAAYTMQRPHAWIAQVAKHQLTRRARCYHLIVNQIGRHADKGEVAPALADNLMPGREADESREALDGDGQAIAHVGSDGLLHG